MFHLSLVKTLSHILLIISWNSAAEQSERIGDGDLSTVCVTMELGMEEISTGRGFQWAIIEAQTGFEIGEGIATDLLGGEDFSVEDEAEESSNFM